MSLEAITWAFRQDIPGTAKLVLLALANRADDETGQCWPGVTRIAKDASCSTRSAQVHIAALARNGFIEIQRVYASTNGRQRSNRYWILFDRVPAPWKSVKHEKIDENLDVEGEGADSAPYTFTRDEESGGGNTNPDSPPPVQPDSSPIIEPSDSESLESRLVETQSTPTEATPVVHPQDVVTDKPKGRMLNQANFDPQRQAKEKGKLQAAYEEQKTKPIFVWVGTDAWKAWVAYKSREAGKPWNLTTTAFEKGKTRLGWWFPKLWPPPVDELATDDSQTLANEMLR